MAEADAAKPVRAQSAVEFLSTYSWALVIIIGAIAIIYLFFNNVISTAPSSCSFSTAVGCADMAVSSNGVGSDFQLLLTNQQQYAIKNPKIYINISGAGNLNGACGPAYVLPGGSIICNVTSTPLQNTQSISGFIIFNQSVCTQLATTSCTQSILESFNGSFSAHVVPFSSFPQCTVTLTGAATAPLPGGPNTFIANVAISGTPLAGATINFTTNSLFTSVVPPYSTTNVNGSASASVSSSAPGSVLVTAKYLSNCAGTRAVAFTTSTSTTSTSTTSTSTTSTSTSSTSTTTTSTVTTTILLGPPPWLDGNGYAIFSSTSSGAVSLTTTHTNDVIILLEGNENEGNGYCGVSSISGDGLTWHLRKAYQQSTYGYQNPTYSDLEEWYAVSSSTVSGSVSVYLGCSIDDAVLTIFGVAGANTISPFDSNGVLPSTNAGSSSTSTVSISTTDANDMLLGFYGTSEGSGSSAAAALPFTLISNHENGGADWWWTNAEEFYNASTPQTTSGTFTNAQSGWMMIGDALRPKNYTT